MMREHTPRQDATSGNTEQAAKRLGRAHSPINPATNLLVLLVLGESQKMTPDFTSDARPCRWQLVGGRIGELAGGRASWPPRKNARGRKEGSEGVREGRRELGVGQKQHLHFRFLRSAPVLPSPPLPLPPRFSPAGAPKERWVEEHIEKKRRKNGRTRK